MLPLSLYEAVFASSPIACCLVSPTSEAIILDVNDALLKTASRKKEDFLGKSVFAAFPGNPEDQKDNGVEALRNSFARVIATGQPDTLPLQRYPIRMPTPDGQERYEERFWSAVNTPIFDQDGKLLCIVHRTTDLTEQVQAETSLRRSEERYRGLFESIDQGFCIIEMLFDERGDPVDYRFCEINPAFEAQTGLRNAVGKTMRELAPDHEKHWFEIYGRVARTGQPIRFENVAKALHRWYDVYGFPTDDPGTNKVAILFKDITERVKEEEAMRQADRRKDEFLAMLAHELRNPLAPIAAAADLLELGRFDEARVKRASAIIARQAMHMASLLDDLLDVARVTRGMISLANIRLDVKRIVSDAAEQVRPLIEARGHRLTVHMPPESVLVLGDEKRLVQIMANLLNNAAKYTPEGGDITVSMEAAGDEVRMTVADNGIGMAPELVDRAFELFTQAERASDRSQGGLGIGLALVKSLVELHGGRVSVDSAGIDQGSRFTVCLSRLQEPASVRIEPGLIMENAPARTLKVMVVDDNAEAAQMLAMLIESLGHRVMVEHGSRSALERARIEVPDVCLLDIGLPDMDGNELARRLRTQPETSGTRLVAVTGYGQERDRQSALRAGFDHHFVKPVNSKTLASLLREIADSTTE